MNVDKNNLLLSMIGHAESTHEVETVPKAAPESAAETPTAGLAAGQYADQPQKQCAAEPSKNRRQPKTSRNHEQAKRADSKGAPDKKSIKIGLYLTPRNQEAIALHKLCHAYTGKVDSDIINAALASYLSREIKALAKQDTTAPTSERVARAAVILLADQE